MAYKALYRTYRPQTFEEVAGQQHIVKTLKNALASGKIAHAYLFAGPRGTGKTTMAKLLAKALNCEHGIGFQCNECKNCKSVIDGSHPDVLELDAASNNGVDEIRELIDKVKYGTILGRYKVYIIDEVHMLSTGAFNALLKTLEEPPEHVIFILATTEPHKILPTILSRCQRYDFEKVSDKDITERIKIVLGEENISYDEEAIKLVVKLSDGGMRDALSILEKVIAYSGNSLNLQDVLDIFSLESTEEKINLIKSINNNDVKDVLDRLNNYLSKGSDIKRLTEDLLGILKDVLIYNNSNNIQYLDTLKADEIEQIAPYISNDKVIEMIDVLLDTIKNFRSVTSIAPLFEITLLKLASISGNEVKVQAPKPEPKFVTVTPTPRVEVKPVEAPKSVETPKPVIDVPTPAPVIKPVEEIKEQVVAPTPKVEDVVPFTNTSPISIVPNVIYLKDTEQEDRYFIDKDLMINIMVSSKKEIKKSLLENWGNIKKLAASPVVGRMASLLMDARPLVASNKMVVVEVQLRNVAGKLNLISNQKELQTIMSKVFNRQLFVYTVDRATSVDYQNEYMNLVQLKRLPKEKDVELIFEGE